ncbi:hypothetical protein [Sphingomonas sp. TREG-RG-20F-R18-01]|uniref:hypothetical protein n=1 Tax=Sphingomonas sp. TREG-RG-20F-R18-01 TaxID=2914982 RepID=UPI001F5865CD|nr:hypothetical protein [Sphingomonas sp. TREG-RG-20F-R18-01]
MRIVVGRALVPTPWLPLSGMAGRLTPNIGGGDRASGECWGSRALQIVKRVANVFELVGIVFLALILFAVAFAGF